MRTLALGSMVTVCLAACGSLPAAEAPRAESQPVFRLGEAPPPEAPVLLRTSSGGIEIVLRSDGSLSAGAARGRAALTGAEAHFMKKQAGLSLVQLAPGERAVLVALPSEETEDPPNRYQLFAFEGPKLRRVLDLEIGTYGVVPLLFPGDGSVRYVEDGWTACERAGHLPMPVVREEVTLRADASGVFAPAHRAPTARSQDCSQLAG